MIPRLLSRTLIDSWSTATYSYLHICTFFAFTHHSILWESNVTANTHRGYQRTLLQTVCFTGKVYQTWNVAIDLFLQSKVNGNPSVFAGSQGQESWRKTCGENLQVERWKNVETKTDTKQLSRNVSWNFRRALARDGTNSKLGSRSSCNESGRGSLGTVHIGCCVL